MFNRIGTDKKKAEEEEEEEVGGGVEENRDTGKRGLAEANSLPLQLQSSTAAAENPSR